MVIKMSKKFEEELNELKKIVDTLENEELALDQSMELFEKGITLYNNCNRIIKDAENKIEILNESTLSND